MLRAVFSRLGLLALGVLAAFVTIELGFRVAGWLAPFGNAEPAPSDDWFVVLCVGDSHTWGRGSGYPGRVAHWLAKRSGQSRVINLGVPGTNTAQLRNRFVHYLDVYRPDVVIFWSGVNNNWNRAETEVWSDAGVEPLGLVERWLGHSRLLRFATVWRNDAERRRLLEAETYVVARDGADRLHENPDRTHDVEVIGGVEEIRNLRGGDLRPEEVVRVTERDLRFMIDRTRERFAAALVITYPLYDPWFVSANDGIERAARATGTPVVSALAALERLKQRTSTHGQELSDFFDESIHPTPMLYDAIGDVVIESLHANRLLPPPTPRQSRWAR